MTTSVGGGPEQHPPLSWSRTVAREMVHRISTAEVLLTDVRRLGDGGFVAAACWPRSHPTFRWDGGGVHSPLVLVETLRQLGIYLPLRYFRVPSSAHLLITDLYFDIDQAREPAAGLGALEVTCRVAPPRLREAEDGAVTGLRLDVTFLAAGSVFARAGGRASLVGEQRYADLRSAARAERSPRPRGCSRPDATVLGVPGRHDVVIGQEGPGEDTFVIDPVDPRHPFFFDHATDHVPGMLLLEAVRQAAAATTAGALTRPRSGRLRMVHFTEFAPPARVRCVPHHRTCVFGVHQLGARTAFGVLGYSVRI